jgi:molybdopterin synthase sulfur carrier subunit
VKLVFLGKLADLAGQGECTLAAPDGLDWPALCARLEGHGGGELRDAVESDETKVAVDGVLATDKSAIRAGESSEIAFLPPVSGG